MNINDKIKQWGYRLEDLKQESLLRYLDYIDLNNEMDLYDVMIRAIAKGDLIDYYSSPVFDSLKEEEISKIKKTFQENHSLCFYDGDINYWLDSLEGVTLQDLDLSVVRLFDHFDFLMGLIKENEDSIPLLKSFQKSHIFQSNSVIDTLRNTFLDDDALKKCIHEVSSSNSLYKGLNDEEKAILFTYPNHILYEKVDDEVYVTDPFSLKKKIIEFLGDDDLSKCSDLRDLIDTIGDSEFENTISNMYLDSLENERGIHR